MTTFKNRRKFVQISSSFRCTAWRTSWFFNSLQASIEAQSAKFRLMNFTWRAIISRHGFTFYPTYFCKI